MRGDMPKLEHHATSTHTDLLTRMFHAVTLAVSYTPPQKAVTTREGFNSHSRTGTTARSHLREAESLESQHLEGVVQQNSFPTCVGYSPESAAKPPNARASMFNINALSASTT